MIGTELDILRNVTIEELAKKYKIRITRKSIKNLESTFGIDFSSLLKEKKIAKSRKTKSKPKKEYEPKPYETIVDEYLPLKKHEYDPIHFLKEHKYTTYIKEIKKTNSVLSEFKDSQLLFEDACHFFIRNEIQIDTTDPYHLIDLYFKNHSKEIGRPYELLVSFYYQVSNELEYSDYYSITKSRLNSLIQNSSLSRLNIENLSPIVVPSKNWYTFSAGILKKYFLAYHIYAFPDNDEFKNQIIYAPTDTHFDNRILEFLQSIDKTRLWSFYLIPELKRLLEHIDFTNEKTIVFSFIDFFSIEFDLIWNEKEKTFENYISSCSESHFDNIFSFCSIEFQISDVETYFTEEYHHVSSPEKSTV